VSTIEEARQLSTPELQLANLNSIAPLRMGSFGYYPSVDGQFVTDIPSLNFLTGAFDHSVTIMAAHNSHEGIIFADPNATNSTAFNDLMRVFLPSAEPSVLSFIENTLYPPIFNGSQPYTTPVERLQIALQNYAINCYPTYLATAFQGKSYNYIFSVPPGEHAEDIPYTFYDENTEGNGTVSGVANSTTAEILQRFITTFAATGTPGAGFPLYGEEGMVLNINKTRIAPEIDPLRNARCAWWQKGLYL